MDLQQENNRLKAINSEMENDISEFATNLTGALGSLGLFPLPENNGFGFLLKKLPKLIMAAQTNPRIFDGFSKLGPFITKYNHLINPQKKALNE